MIEGCALFSYTSLVSVKWLCTTSPWALDIASAFHTSRLPSLNNLFSFNMLCLILLNFTSEVVPPPLQIKVFLRECARDLRSKNCSLLGLLSAFSKIWGSNCSAYASEVVFLFYNLLSITVSLWSLIPISGVCLPVIAAIVDGGSSDVSMLINVSLSPLC